MYPARARRRVAFLVPAAVLLGTLALGACSSPPTGRDSFDTGRRTVVDLVNRTGAALPPASGYRPQTVSDTDRELCHRTALGYSVGKTGTRRPQLTTIVELPGTTAPKDLLPAIGAAWEQAGYRVDRNDFDNPHFPRLRAKAGDYSIVATAFVDTPGFANRPRVTLYAVGPCLR